MSFSFDPLSPAFAENPYATYSELRDFDCPHFDVDLEMVLLARYEDIATIATNPAMLRSLDGIETPAQARERQVEANWHDMPFHERFVQTSLLDSDGDTHRRLRKQIFGEFTARRVGKLESTVQAFVDALLDDLQHSDSFDFVNDFAAHIPGHVIGHLLGVPAEDCPQLRIWSERVVQFFDVDRSDKRKQLAETATREFHDYLVDLRQERSVRPRDDLISKMIADERSGHYSPDEFISTCMLILMAGHGSTIDVLGSGMHTLLKYPHETRQLREDPRQLPNAIQEMFRYESPLPFFHRHATEDVILRGHHFPAGTTFGLLYGAANRDPGQFANPDRFDIARHPNRHLAFGLGAHLCLGNNLARLNMRVIFETLLRRYRVIELAADHITYKPGLSVRGPTALPVKLHFESGPLDSRLLH
ncbi:MAG: cytochrome P450 [Ahrensia sp.]|nr:cytochrome P450 [Ahrensia sp.]